MTKRQSLFYLTIVGFSLFLAIGCKRPGTIIGDGVADIQGNEYPTVIIGEQEWMAENLRTTKYKDGTEIVNITNSGEWSQLDKGAYAWYNNDENLGEIHGALYNWRAVSSEMLCPDGWRMPDHKDWELLMEYLENEYGIKNKDIVDGLGNALKSCRQEESPLGGHCNTNDHPRWNKNSEHYGTDIFGFSALPSGYRASNGSFSSIGRGSLFWNAAGDSKRDISRMWITNDNGSIRRYTSYPLIGASVRCIKD